MNIDVKVCCDVTICKLVQSRCMGGTFCVHRYTSVIWKNFIVPALGVVALGQWLLRLMYSVLKMDTAGCSEISAPFIQIT
jgi:hypothetical protein